MTAQATTSTESGRTGQAEGTGQGERRAIVIGAGIVGVCSGLELLKRGWSVTIIDRLPPGEGCSFGNAGILAAQGVVPVAHARES